MCGQVPSLDTNLFLRFLGQPTEAFGLLTELKCGVGQPHEAGCCELTWKRNPYDVAVRHAFRVGTGAPDNTHLLPLVAACYLARRKSSLFTTNRDCKGREGVRSL